MEGRERSNVYSRVMSAEHAPGAASREAEALVQRYRAPLQRFFERRLRDRSEAEDLAHEVLVRLIRQRSLAQTTRPAYIFLTARSVLLDKARKDRVRVRASPNGPDGDGLDAEAPSAERVYAGQARVERVSQLLAQLSPRVRQVFLMHRIEGLAYSEIARTLGITMSTVEKHIMAALRFLVEHTDEECK